MLDDPRRVAEDIDAVVRAIWREQRPGYLEIHRDMVERTIEVPEAIRDWDGGLEFARSDERKTAEAARETAARFNAARRPVGDRRHRDLSLQAARARSCSWSSAWARRA